MSGLIFPSPKDQDCINIEQNESFSLFVLADGHGGEEIYHTKIKSFGKIASEYSTLKICEKFKEIKETDDEIYIKEKMSNSFIEIHEELKEEFIKLLKEYEEKNLLFDKINHIPRGGTTLASVYYSKNREGKQFIVCANVGDSEAFVFSKDKIHNLTTCHNPDNENEYKRISSFIGKKGECVYNTSRECDINKYIKIYDENGVKYPKDEIIKKYGAKLSFSTIREDLACYFASSNPQMLLSITRSIGDYYAHEIGSTCIPDMQIYYPTEEDKFVFIASDGILDCFHYEELKELVIRDISDEELLKIFKDKAISLFNKYYDDISFIRFKL
jgi:serine/threonine protein phosphatase PrpC